MTHTYILAVPNNALSCAVGKYILIPILCTDISMFFVTLPRSPKTRSSTVNSLRFQSLWISSLIFWYFSIFHFQVNILLSKVIAASMIIAVFSILLAIKKSGFLSTMTLSHCIFMSHISIWLTFSVTVWGFCRYHFSDFSKLKFSHNFQLTILTTSPCLLFYSLWASVEYSITI